MIRLENIHVTFNPGSALEKKAIRGIKLGLKQGDFVTVIGANGAGKSTLLNTLCGDVTPTKGKVLIDGKNVTPLQAYQRVDLVARVFQDPRAGTCPNLTIAENMALAYARGKRRGFKLAIEDSHRYIFKEHLARLNLGLENRLDDAIGGLSGGQRQAVSLIMAVLQPMKILALDEHTAALDPKTAAFILDLTQQIVEEQGLTTLMVTHSMQQALGMGTRTIMLYEGKVIFDVSGEERKKLNVKDLLDLFHKAAGQELDDDKLLLE